MITLSTLPHAPLGIGLKLQLVIEFTRFPASFYISQVWCCQNAVVTKVLWVSSKLPEIPSMEAHCRRQWENDVQKCSGAYTHSFKMRSRPWTDSLSSTLYINRPPIWSRFYLCTVILGLLFITLINKNPWHSQAVDKILLLSQWVTLFGIFQHKLENFVLLLPLNLHTDMDFPSLLMEVGLNAVLLLLKQRCAKLFESNNCILHTWYTPIPKFMSECYFSRNPYIYEYVCMYVCI